MDDPEFPGVFVKARKPTEGWATVSLAGMPGVTPVREPLKILGLPANPDGCGYHRFWQPYAQLAQRSGHTVVVPPPGRHAFLPDEDEIAEFDVVARQRANGRHWLRAWRRWRQDGLAKLVYEVDDHILDGDQTDLPDWLAAEVQETVVGCLELADLVTCSTEPLAAELRRHNPNVVVIPNFMHEDLLAIERPRREQVTVGWAGGFTHLQDLVEVQQPLRDLLHGVSPTPDLHMIGHDYRSLVGHVGRFTPWQPNVWSYYQEIDFDIGLAPLRDTAFNRSRSAIKALELGALGIPVVASDMEPYREFVVDGATGFLCRTEADWYGRLRDLVHDAGMRAEMGAKAKEVARGWTIQQGWRRWADAYEQLAGWPAQGGTT